MNTFKSRGNRIPYTAGSNLSAGAIVAVESGTSGKIGILVADIANGATGEVEISGVHTLTKVSGAITYGAKVYYNGTGITATSSGNTLAGYAVEAKGTSATTIDVLVNGLPSSN